MERPLQPPHRAERAPKDEDTAYDEARQREVDAESELEALLATTVRMVRAANDDTARDAVKFVYLQGRIDGILAK